MDALSSIFTWLSEHEAGFSLAGVKPFLSTAQPALVERTIDALGKAGLPE